MNGDFVTDIVYSEHVGLGQSDRVSVLQGKDNYIEFEKRDFRSDYLSPDSKCLAWDGQKKYGLANPHSSAFVDLNGDCVPDLTLTLKDGNGNLEQHFFLHQMVDGAVFYCLVQRESLTHSELITFADFGRPAKL